MRKMLLLPFLLLWMASRANTIRWDGEGGDGMWSNPANWVGDILPGSLDDVILDNSQLPANYNVVLPAGTFTISIRSMVIVPAASGNITVLIPSSSMASPALQLTGTVYSLILHNGAILKNSSGASSGIAIAISDSFRINNGGRYIHNTGRASAAIVSQLSRSAGTEYGIFEYDVPVASYTLSLSGRYYGTLVLSATTRNTNYTGTGASPLNILGDLIINTGVSFSIGMSADIIIHRHCQIASSSVLNLQTSAAANLVRLRGNLQVAGRMGETGNGQPVLEFMGESNQYVSVTGSFTDSITLRINNSASVVLESSLSLPYHLQLVKGKIKSSLTNLLSMVDNSICTGASASSFVEGPMRKAGNDDFIFPVGVGQIYAPIGIGGGTGSISDQFTAEYKRSNPQTRFGINYESGSPHGPIDHISYVEYWELSSNSNASKSISLAVNCQSFCLNPSTLFIAGYDEMTRHWKNAGRTAIQVVSPSACTSQYRQLTITAANINSFSRFTLATSEPFSGNPLPLRDMRTFSQPPVFPFLSVESSLASSELRVRIVSPSTQYLEILIVDIMGRTVRRKQSRVHAGITNILFILNDLSSGPWFLAVIQEDGKINTTRFIKR